MKLCNCDVMLYDVTLRDMISLSEVRQANNHRIFMKWGSVHLEIVLQNIHFIKMFLELSGRNPQLFRGRFRWAVLGLLPTTAPKNCQLFQKAVAISCFKFQLIHCVQRMWDVQVNNIMQQRQLGSSLFTSRSPRSVFVIYLRSKFKLWPMNLGQSSSSDQWT